MPEFIVTVYGNLDRARAILTDPVHRDNIYVGNTGQGLAPDGSGVQREFLNVRATAVDAAAARSLVERILGHEFTVSDASEPTH